MTNNFDINFDKLFTYPLSPNPWSLATPDGGYVKTDKSQLMHALEAEVVHENSDIKLPDNEIAVIDGNALIQSLAHLPETFGELW